MWNKNTACREKKLRRLKISLVVSHFLFLMIILFEAPYLSEFYQGQTDLIIGEMVATYIIYLLPFVIWHSGDAIQGRFITPSSLACLTSFWLALSIFVANMLWGVAFAVDLVNVPDAHEVGTLNFYGVFITFALLGLAALVSLIKLGGGLYSRFRASER